MANGTIAFDTLQTSGQITGTSKSVDTDYLASGIKHWVNYDAINQTTDGSLNQSSLTDSATGLFISTYTNVLSGASNKCILGMGWDTANDGSSQQTVNATGGINMEQDGNSASLTTAIKVKVFKGSTGSVDGQEVDYSGNYWSTIGDLA
tara:strand:+ start:315 stop:761 length:447 start_codon:yes stop_codon:yes gene_type:complete